MKLYMIRTTTYHLHGSHVGVQGNELADHLAKAGTTKPQAEIDTDMGGVYQGPGGPGPPMTGPP